MSTNTLRGIGQDGEGKGAGAKGGTSTQDAVQNRPVEADPESGSTGLASPASPDRRRDEVQPPAGASSTSAPDSAQEQRRIRSLDSTVPGTRSLDSRVPDQHPWQDTTKTPHSAHPEAKSFTSDPETKNAAFAGTLQGTPAPIIVGRDQGTVQGRNVHLPVEAHRFAGVRPVADIAADDWAPTPIPVERSEPTRSDPIRTKLAARASVVDVLSDVLSDSGTSALDSHDDLNKHAPWYDQDTTDLAGYETERPNILGRIAIAAAAAAALSVVLFAIVRLNGEGAGVDESDVKIGTTSPTVLVPPVAARPAAPPSADPSPDPAPSSPAPISPPLTPGFETAPGPSATREPESPRIEPAPAAPPKAPPVSRHRTPATNQTAATNASTPEVSSVNGSFLPSTAPPPHPAARATTPVAPTPPVAPKPQSVEPPPLGTPLPAKPAPTPVDKPRSKPSYDPDSTLPLSGD